MAYVSIPWGVPWPATSGQAGNTTAVLGGTINASTDKVAFIGQMYWDDRAASKTVDTTGSSAIVFRTGTTTFAATGPSSTIDVGIQDLAGAGAPGEPDGVFDVKTTLTSGTDTISSAAFKSCAMTSGSKTIAHGQWIAVVIDMTVRAGADSVNIVGWPIGLAQSVSFTNSFDSSAWAAGSEVGATVGIVASDGTVGTLDGGVIAAVTNESFQNSSNPDERGMLFQVPFDCKVDALWVDWKLEGDASDCVIKLYSDPLGTPTIMGTGNNATVTVTPENTQNYGATVGERAVYQLPEQVTLSKNTDYVVAVDTSGGATQNVTIFGMTFPSQGYMALYPGGTASHKHTRNGGSGAFAPATTIRYNMGVRISQVDDGTGSGGSSVPRHILHPIEAGI